MIIYFYNFFYDEYYYSWGVFFLNIYKVSIRCVEDGEYLDLFGFFGVLWNFC